MNKYQDLPKLGKYNARGQGDKGPNITDREQRGYQTPKVFELGQMSDSQKRCTVQATVTKIKDELSKGPRNRRKHKFTSKCLMVLWFQSLLVHKQTKFQHGKAVIITEKI